MLTFIIIFGGLLAVYLLLNLMMQLVPEVEAGPTSNLKSTGVRRVSGGIRASYKKTEADGTISLHRNFVVRGKCMEMRGIEDGSIVDVRVFNKCDRSRMRDRLSDGDIVLIYLNDSQFRGYKLRIVRELREEDAITFYYEGGAEKASSKPHAYKDILGIVVEQGAEG